MKVVVYWENQNERKFASRIAGLIRALMAKQRHANVVVEVEHRDRFAPYRNNAEVLALEAQRLLDAQEEAFGDRPAAFDPSGWLDIGYLSKSGLTVKPVNPPDVAAFQRAHQSLEVQFVEERTCLHPGCLRTDGVQGNSRAAIDEHFRNMGWLGAFCPSHRQRGAR